MKFTLGRDARDSYPFVHSSFGVIRAREFDLLTRSCMKPTVIWRQGLISGYGPSHMSHKDSTPVERAFC